MKSKIILIVDLDDTIFETKSMNPAIFQPAISIIEKFYTENHDQDKVKNVLKDLWAIPIDEVFKIHNTPEDIKEEFFQKLGAIEYNLEITPFEDYIELKSLNCRKILVTTGFSKLQRAKIKALSIEQDFEEIYIDDPLSPNRKFKKGIFKEIIDKTNKEASEFWIIGDNPDSEIGAGKSLGMNTIQRITNGKEISDLADYKIDSFKELYQILKKWL